MKSFIKHGLAVAAATVAFGAQALIIDDFSTAQTAAFNFTTADGGQWATQVGPSGSIIGGYRDLFIIKDDSSTSANNNITGISSVSVNGGVAGKMSFSSTDDTKAVGIVRWDGALAGTGGTAGASGPAIGAAVGSIDPIGLQVAGVGKNLLATGPGFTLTVTTADLNFPFTLQAFTNGANWSAVTIYSTGIGSYFIPFGGFVTIAGAGADFSNIGALQAIINFDPLAAGNGTVQSVDFSIDLVDTAVPEPGILALVGVSILGLGVARRRRVAAK